jgi:Uma2 family endonuclease
MPVQAPRRLFTAQEFHQMAAAGLFQEDDRVELLAGEVVEMTPIGSRHAACVNRLTRLFSEMLPTALVTVQNPIRLSEQSEPQPDVAVVRFKPDFYRDAHPGPGDVLLIVEVADTSADVDRDIKVPLYARAGILEVWAIDLQSRVVDVYGQPSPEGYRDHQRLGPGERLMSACLPALDVAVSDLVS